MIQKLAALFIVFALLITIFRDYMWWIIGVVVLLYLIRLGADAYWEYKDSKEW